MSAVTQELPVEEQITLNPDKAVNTLLSFLLRDLKKAFVTVRDIFDKYSDDEALLKYIDTTIKVHYQDKKENVDIDHQHENTSKEENVCLTLGYVYGIYILEHMLYEHRTLTMEAYAVNIDYDAIENDELAKHLCASLEDKFFDQSTCMYIKKVIEENLSYCVSIGNSLLNPDDEEDFRMLAMSRIRGDLLTFMDMVEDEATDVATLAAVYQYTCISGGFKGYLFTVPSYPSACAFGNLLLSTLRIIMQQLGPIIEACFTMKYPSTTGGLFGRHIGGDLILNATNNMANLASNSSGAVDKFYNLADRFTNTLGMSE